MTVTDMRGVPQTPSTGSSRVLPGPSAWARTGAPRPGERRPTDPGDQLDAILGEHVLPIRGRRPGHDDPHLLAVDASGLPVVVEVVATLDEVTAMRALRHTGRAARLTTPDLAALYPGGPDRFAEHFQAFRTTVPATSLLSPWVRSGARLLLVCAEVDPQCEDLLEFLLQPAWQVEMLQVEVADGPKGRRVTGVRPVVRFPPRREARGSKEADPQLAQMGALFGEPMPLVWARPGGALLEGILHVDGWIELADGSLLPDADAAALRAGGVAANGSHVWRLGHEGGPTLAEAALELGLA